MPVNPPPVAPREAPREAPPASLDVIFYGDTPPAEKGFLSDVYQWMQRTMYFCFYENSNWKENGNDCNYVRCEECTGIIGRVVVFPDVEDGEYARFELQLREGDVKVSVDTSSWVPGTAVPENSARIINRIYRPPSRGGDPQQR